MQCQPAHRRQIIRVDDVSIDRARCALLATHVDQVGHAAIRKKAARQLQLNFTETYEQDCFFHDVSLRGSARMAESL
jgi:hypothetical protein